MKQMTDENRLSEFLKQAYQHQLEDSASMKEAVYLALKEGILTDQLGSKITENQISSILDVSRTPVREAMHKLSTDGLLEISHGRKAKIIELSRKDAADIALVLRTLHVLAAELFIDNANENDIRKLEESMVLASFYCEQNDIHKMAGFLTEFHATTAIGSGNKWLADTVVRLLSYTTLHREYALSRTGRSKISIKEHMDILEAIRTRNKVRARELLNHHVDSAFDPCKFQTKANY